MEDKKGLDLTDELQKEIDQLKNSLKEVKSELDEKNKLLAQYDAAYKEQLSRYDNLYGIVGTMVDYIALHTTKKN